MEPIDIKRFSREMREAMLRARNRTGLSIPKLLEHLPIGQRTFLDWQEKPRPGKSCLPTLKSLAMILQPIANLGLKKMRVKNTSQALLDNFNRCDPEIKLFITLFAEVMAKDRTKTKE